MHPEVTIAPRGSPEQLEGLAPDTDRELISSLCAPHGEVAFLDYSRGEPCGFVRFRTAAGAGAAATAYSSGGSEGGNTPSWRLLSDEEAEAYRREAQAKRAAKGGGKGKGGGGKGRGAPRGWGGGRGRARGSFL